MSHSLVEALRARGVDVVTVLEVGMVERSDQEHLDYASSQGRTLYSFNISDLYRLHTEYVSGAKAHAGMILARQQHYSVGEQMRRLLKLLGSKSAEDMQNHVEFLGGWG